MGWKQDVTSRMDNLQKVVLMMHKTLLTIRTELNEVRRDVQLLQKDRGKTIDRMSDRLIEMAMVARGGSRDASLHRRSSQESQEPDEPHDIWQDQSDSEWPPPGCDAVNLP